MNTIITKQEIDIVQRILDQVEYSEDFEKVNLKLSQFEGKHFRHLSTNDLLKRVQEVCTKLKNKSLINSFAVLGEGTAQNIFIIFNLQQKSTQLNEYKKLLEKEIANEELQVKLKKNNYCQLDHTSKVFYFMLPNGAVQAIPLWTERAESDHIFLLFKVLYEHWLEYGERVISKGLMKSKLIALGWHEVTDKNLSSSIANIRKTKIAPAKLSQYVEISFEKNNESEEGYKLKIIYP